MALLPRITIEWPHLLMLGQINSWKHGWKSRICGDIPSTRTASLDLWSDPLGNADRWSHWPMSRSAPATPQGRLLSGGLSEVLIWPHRVNLADFRRSISLIWLKFAYKGLNLITVLCWCSLPRTLLIFPDYIIAISVEITRPGLFLWFLSLCALHI